MAIFDKRKTEEQIYERMIAAGEQMGGGEWKDDTQLLYELLISQEPYDIRLRMTIHPEEKVYTIYSMLPFSVPAEIRAEFSLRLLQFNYERYQRGTYDFAPSTGTIVFRISIPYSETEITTESILENYNYVFNAVKESNVAIYNIVEELSANRPMLIALDEARKTIEKIDELVGWAEYKKLCHEIFDMAPIIQKDNLADVFRGQNYLFAVDNGYGMTKCLNLFAQLCHDLGMIGGPARAEVYEYQLSDTEGNGKYTFDQVMNELMMKEGNSLICMDISFYLDRSRQNDLKEFLYRLADYRKTYLFVFRVPYLEQESLRKVYHTIAEVLSTRALAIQPFSNQELKCFAAKILAANSYSMDEAAWDRFYQKLCKEKSEGKFYGIRTVENIVREMLWIKVRTESGKKSDNGQYETNRCINGPELSTLVKTGTEKVGYGTLEEMIGMEEITGRIREIVLQVKTAMENGKLERPCLHMRFVGAPGTGKTTVARAIGEIFRESGILRNGYFFEYTSRDLCGQYVGQTAPKTSAICRDAYGSVLFIDEAYALYQGNGESGQDYGREALTTLIAEMENHRDDMVVIMAGYTDDMDTLMKGNAGLRSRMPFVLEFRSYDKKQLGDIFMSFVNKHFRCSEDFEPAVREYFNSMADSYINSKEFSNARFVRNLYERTWSKAALRRCMANEAELILKKEDFISASSENEFSEKLMMQKKIGF